MAKRSPLVQPDRPIERSNIVWANFGRRVRPADRHPINAEPTVAPLTVEQLEKGVRMLDQGEIEPNVFWDQNVAAFRQTVLCAIDETGEALSSQHISAELRAELEAQVEPLKFYLEIADCYLARRGGRTN